MNKSDKLDLIHESWRSILVKFIGAHIVFSDVDLSTELKEQLQKIGLPLLGFDYAIKFIPQTYITELNINSKFYWLIGDLSVNAPGISFVAIEKNTDLIYRLNRGREDESKWIVSYLNNSLENFIIFLWEYCQFLKKYKKIGHASIDGNEMVQDYNEMEEKLKSLDLEAMNNNNYWDNMVYSIKSIYGDFLI